MSRYNDILLQSIILLIGLGLVMVYSASVSPLHYGENSGVSTLITQFKWLILGLIGLFICSFMNHKKLSQISQAILIFSILVAILAYFTSYDKVTSRWLILFGRPIFQTSEFVKIGIIIFTASFIANNKRKIPDFNFMIKNYYPYLVLSVAVVLFQPDLSSSIMILGISLSMIFIAGMDKKQIRFLLFLLAGAFILKFLLIPLISGSWNFQIYRLFGFLTGDAVQQENAINSIADGGFFGIGFGESRWKGDYVAAPQTDFIYSVITSELGFFGLIILVGSFLIIFSRGIGIVRECKDLFGMFLALGITFNLIFYFIIHVGYNVGILPTTGLPLPFVSYGGSHTIFNLSQIGLLLSISYRMKDEKY